MAISRGTRVVLIQGMNGAILGDSGKVSSRTKNGWLRVTLDRTNETISVRNVYECLRTEVFARPAVEVNPGVEVKPLVQTPTVSKKLDFSDEEMSKVDHIVSIVGAVKALRNIMSAFSFANRSAVTDELCNDSKAEADAAWELMTAVKEQATILISGCIHANDRADVADKEIVRLENLIIDRDSNERLLEERNRKLEAETPVQVIKSKPVVRKLDFSDEEMAKVAAIVGAVNAAQDAVLDAVKVDVWENTDVWVLMNAIKEESMVLMSGCSQANARANALEDEIFQLREEMEKLRNDRDSNEKLIDETINELKESDV